MVIVPIVTGVEVLTIYAAPCDKKKDNEVSLLRE